MKTGDLVLLRQASSDEGSWRVSAACADASTAAFFEDGDSSDDVVTARAWGAPADAESAALTVCGGCPVRTECLTHALRTPEPYGIWGGTTPAERESILLGLAG